MLAIIEGDSVLLTEGANSVRLSAADVRRLAGSFPSSAPSDERWIRAERAAELMGCYDKGHLSFYLGHIQRAPQDIASLGILDLAADNVKGISSAGFRFCRQSHCRKKNNQD